MRVDIRHVRAYLINTVSHYGQAWLAPTMDGGRAGGGRGTAKCSEDAAPLLSRCAMDGGGGARAGSAETTKKGGYETCTKCECDETNANHTLINPRAHAAANDNDIARSHCSCC